MYEYLTAMSVRSSVSVLIGLLLPPPRNLMSPRLPEAADKGTAEKGKVRSIKTEGVVYAKGVADCRPQVQRKGLRKYGDSQM